MKNYNEVKQTIVCPYCGWEYLPSEIFYPDHFLGQESNVERDSFGKILYYENLDSDHDEHYICDHCEKQFFVHADIKFSTSADEMNNLNNNYYTQKPVKLFLDEE